MCNVRWHDEEVPGELRIRSSDSRFGGNALSDYCGFFELHAPGHCGGRGAACALATGGTEQPIYALAGAGGCPTGYAPVPTPASCAAAARSLGLGNGTFHVDRTEVPAYPKGCYARSLEGRVYWNSAAPGRQTADAHRRSPVCALNGGAPLPTCVQLQCAGGVLLAGLPQPDEGAVFYACSAEGVARSPEGAAVRCPERRCSPAEGGDSGWPLLQAAAAVSAGALQVVVRGRGGLGSGCALRLQGELLGAAYDAAAGELRAALPPRLARAAAAGGPLAVRCPDPRCSVWGGARLCAAAVLPLAAAPTALPSAAAAPRAAEGSSLPAWAVALAVTMGLAAVGAAVLCLVARWRHARKRGRPPEPGPCAEPGQRDAPGGIAQALAPLDLGALRGKAAPAMDGPAGAEFG
eukprot:TRINITY_DN33639_c0_g1_i1.p3 TRINITY_DN33639_c0_g1~~TRINITY_DN33639_c0_g1_i1.p3  ORF type:complete len:407 (+),score=78.71 TRINITY_DN33639_c0_g1_i1:1234-2454(+)